MSTTRPSPATPSEDNNLVGITPWSLQFARWRVLWHAFDHQIEQGTRTACSTEESEEWLRSASKTLVDTGPTISIRGSERPSSAAGGGQDRVGKDSSQRIPGGIHSPLAGRANEYNPGKGEKEDMPRFPYAAATGFTAVKTVLESHPDDVVEHSLIELSQTYAAIEPEELERRLANLSEALATKNEEIKKAYSWTRTTLGALVAVLCGIVLLYIIDAIANVAVPVFVNVLAAVAGAITGLLVIVAARLVYRVREEVSRHQFLQWSVNDRIGILKEKQKMQAS